MSRATRTKTIGRMVIEESKTTLPITCARPEPMAAPTARPITPITAVSPRIILMTEAEEAPMAFRSANSLVRSTREAVDSEATARAAATRDRPVMRIMRA